jgi:hypothetical protein
VHAHIAIPRSASGKFRISLLLNRRHDDAFPPGSRSVENQKGKAPITCNETKGAVGHESH